VFYPVWNGGLLPVPMASVGVQAVPPEARQQTALNAGQINAGQMASTVRGSAANEREIKFIRT
jgi:hypothetical protein